MADPTLAPAPSLLSLPFVEIHADGKGYLTHTGQSFLLGVLAEFVQPPPAVNAGAALAAPPRTFGHSAVAWKPTIIGSTTAGVQTYGATTAGWAVEIGALVVATFSVQLATLGGTIAGNALIGGLPFASNASGPPQAGWLSRWGNITLSAGKTNLGVEFAVGAASLGLVQSASAAATLALPVTGLSGTALVVGGVAYFK